MSTSLADILKSGQPFCLLAKRSPATGSVEKVAILEGEICRHTFVRELPKDLTKKIQCISIVPFAQIRERGYEAVHDDERIISLHVARERTESFETVAAHGRRALPAVDIIGHNMSLQDFEERVASIVNDVIGGGEGSSFLFSRKTFLDISDFGPDVAMAVFIRLIETELGFYLAFLFFDGERYFVGASPERHLTIVDGRATMNPICGTLPKASVRSREDFISFLRDPKEIDELFQVVDESLKIMAAVCHRGGVISGPFIKEMGTLFHTEYNLEGDIGFSILEAFSMSMFAPTMIGSPMESAARVIARYEDDSRRYYSSAILIQGNEDNNDYLDSAITIRTLEISAGGRGIVQAGASIVRESNPRLESLEIEAKSSSILGLFVDNGKPQFSAGIDLEEMRLIAKERNDRVSHFWLNKSQVAPVRDFSALIVDNEDDFTYMLKHMLSRLGGAIEIIRSAEIGNAYDDFDLTVLGPGPGDPENDNDPRIRESMVLVDKLFNSRSKFLGVCLGHQLVARHLNFRIQRATPPPQGTQIDSTINGASEKLGFYNSYFAIKPDTSDGSDHRLEIDQDHEGRILAMRGAHFSTFQFHLESILTQNGYEILEREIHRLGVIG